MIEFQALIAALVCGAVAWVSYGLGARRRNDGAWLDLAKEHEDRIDRLETASKHALQWSNMAEDEFDRINTRIEGVPKLGAYRAAQRQSVDRKP